MNKPALLTTMTALLFGLVAPTAEAQDLPDLPEYCPTPDPDAWTSLCLRFYPNSGSHVWVDASQSERVCVFNEICVEVPLVRPSSKVTTIYAVEYQAAVMTENMREDICRITGLLCGAPAIHISLRWASLDPSTGATGLAFEADGETYYLAFTTG